MKIKIIKILLNVLLVFFASSSLSIASAEIPNNISLPVPFEIIMIDQSYNSVTKPLIDSVFDLISNGKHVPKWLKLAQKNEPCIFAMIETLNFKKGILSDKARIRISWFYWWTYETDWILLKEKTFNFRSGIIINRANTDDFMSETGDCVKYLLGRR